MRYRDASLLRMILKHSFILNFIIGRESLIALSSESLAHQGFQGLS